MEHIRVLLLSSTRTTLDNFRGKIVKLHLPLTTSNSGRFLLFLKPEERYLLLSDTLREVIVIYPISFHYFQNLTQHIQKIKDKAEPVPERALLSTLINHCVAYQFPS